MSSSERLAQSVPEEPEQTESADKDSGKEDILIDQTMLPWIPKQKSSLYTIPIPLLDQFGGNKYFLQAYYDQLSQPIDEGEMVISEKTKKPNSVFNSHLEFNNFPEANNPSQESYLQLAPHSVMESSAPTNPHSEDSDTKAFSQLTAPQNLENSATLFDQSTQPLPRSSQKSLLERMGEHPMAVLATSAAVGIAIRAIKNKS